MPLIISFDPIVNNASGYRVRYREIGDSTYILHPTTFYNSPAILSSINAGEYEGYVYPVCNPTLETYFSTEEEDTTTVAEEITINLWAMGLYQTEPEFPPLNFVPNYVRLIKNSGSSIFTPVAYRQTNTNEIRYARWVGDNNYTTPYPCIATISRGATSTLSGVASPELGGSYSDYRVRKVLKIDGVTVQDFNQPVIGSNNLTFTITTPQSNTISTIDVEIWGLRADNTWE